jgi:hypothetical protein
VADERSLPAPWRDAVLDPGSFLPVLVLCVATMIVVPFTGLVRGGGILAFPFTVALVVVALRRSGVSPATMRFAAVVIGVVAVSSITALVVGLVTEVDDRHVITISSAGFAVLFALVFPSMVRAALGHRRVNLNTLTAAVSAYLVIGLWFTMIYLALASVSPQPFFAGSPTPTVGEFEYFSFVTLTTVGYGDLAPLAPAGRAAAVAQAILGQVYLVTTVARVVSLYGSERRAAEAPGGLHEFRSRNAD